MKEEHPFLNPPTLIAVITMVIFAGTVAAVFKYGTNETISQVVGGVTALAGAVISYFFGSSRGSTAKDIAAAELQKKFTDIITPSTPQEDRHATDQTQKS